MAQTDAVGRCYLMPGLGWTAPEGPIQKIVKDPRHGRDVYYVKRADGAELFLQPDAGEVVPCASADSAATLLNAHPATAAPGGR